MKDIAQQLKENKNNEWAPLQGDGDFRSDECIELLKQSDVVVTNPPFSLFREYIKQLFDYNKKFVIIGNKSAVTGKDIFPLIRDNKMWVGTTSYNKDILFIAPLNADLSNRPKTAIRKVDGVTYLRSPSVWFTNLDHGRRHRPLPLMTMKDNLKYSKHKEIMGKKDYSHYEDYDAIEVNYYDAIPSDYYGVMGVAVSFLDKYNPEQFEILECHEPCIDLAQLKQNPTFKEYKSRQIICGRKSCQKTYHRFFIKHRKK